MTTEKTIDWRSAVLLKLHALDICNCGSKTPQAESHADSCPRNLTNGIALLIPDAEAKSVPMHQAGQVAAEVLIDTCAKHEGRVAA